MASEVTFDPEAVKSDLSEEEEAMVARLLEEKEVREAIPEGHPEIYCKFFFARFVRARKQVYPEVLEMLLACLAWRKQVRADTIIEWFPQLPEAARIIEYWPTELHGRDAQGRPIVFERLTLLHPVSMMKMFSAELVMQFHIYSMELNQKAQREASAREGVFFYGGTVVEDLVGLSWSFWHGPAVELLKSVMAVDAANYPEALVAFHVINAPRLFSVLYRMLAPFVDPATREKVTVSSGAEALSSDAIPASSLPKEYGGTCTEHEGDTCLHDAGGSMLVSVDGAQLETLNVPARDKVEVSIDVDDVPAILGYEFSTESYDVEFELQFLKRGAKKPKTLFKTERVLSHVESVCDSIEVHDAGTFTFVWHNEYSWTTAKTVCYRVLVQQQELEPKGKGKKLKKKKHKKKKVACRDCQKVYKDVNAKQCLECGSSNKKLV